MKLNTFERTLITGGAYLTALITPMIGLNTHSHHNVTYTTEEGERVFQKIDGILDYTEIEIQKEGGVRIRRASFLDGKTLTDKDGDWWVDDLTLNGNPFIRGSHPESFNRKEHFSKYPQVFHKADRDYREQMRRFKPLMTKK